MQRTPVKPVKITKQRGPRGPRPRPWLGLPRLSIPPIDAVALTAWEMDALTQIGRRHIAGNVRIEIGCGFGRATQARRSGEIIAAVVAILVDAGVLDHADRVIAVELTWCSALQPGELVIGLRGTHGAKSKIRPTVLFHVEKMESCNV